MENQPISFLDGAAYERYMGRWSRPAGEAFLDWLAPKPGLAWLDIGCGTGAFTEILAARGAPASLAGVDPSAEQVAFARTRPPLRGADFRQGDAMALPYPAGSFDAAVMPLVLYFLPDPARGVAEMARVVRPGGWVTAYSWDMTGGGFPYALLQQEMRALGVAPLTPPSPEASRLDVLLSLWRDAGLVEVETREIPAQRTFESFEDYWETVLGGPSVGGRIKTMSPEQTVRLQAKLRELLPRDASGRIACGARANAVKGRVPG